MFVGEHDRSVDGTGRVALPADFRRDLGERCYLAPHPEGFLQISSEEVFHAAAKRLLDKIAAGEEPASAARRLGKNSHRVSIDKQGRITIDDGLRQHAGLTAGTQATVVGSLDTIQLWRSSRYRQIDIEDGVEDQARVWIDGDDE